MWLLNHTGKFPKSQRFVMAKRMEEAGLALHDNLLWATKTRRKRSALDQADYHLERLRVYNRVCLQLKLHSFKQYEYLSKNLTEIGNLLGGWFKALCKQPPLREKRE